MPSGMEHMMSKSAIWNCGKSIKDSLNVVNQSPSPIYRELFLKKVLISGQGLMCRI